jgi:PPOX class probable F420-dependent enzyme
MVRGVGGTSGTPTTLPAAWPPARRRYAEPVQLPAALCRERAATAAFAVLATRNARDGIDLVPITFALLAGPVDVVVSAVDHKPKSTDRLQRLQNIARHPEVTLLFDQRSEDWTALWWVRAQGRAVERSPGHRVEALVARYQQYRDRPPRGPVIEITVDRWTGWAAAG